jgi:hypothetical protein
MFRIIILSSLLLLTQACPGGRKKMSVNEAVTAKGVMKIEAFEIEDKPGKAKYTIRVNISNLNSESILFFLGETQCFKGKSQGRLNHAFFGAGERAINLLPGQLKTFNFVCDYMKPDAAGGYRLVFGRIFTNPNNDGKTTDKQLAKDLEIDIGGSGSSGEKSGKKDKDKGKEKDKKKA